MITYDPNLKIFFSSLINDDHFFSGFATKAVSDGRKVKNVFNFFQSQSLSFKKIIIPEQIHSVNIELFQSKDK
ncbi:hypothetical protein CO007_03650, partial [Candidatus Roizmanbacteria bacterium CG_4_8_14_3_um_filter_36_10]